MKLYDPKFVHFEWSDELDGKCCFVADYIGSLIKSVNENDTTSRYGKVSKADETSMLPFNCQEPQDIPHTAEYHFAYYDPNYNVKYAYWERGLDIYYRLKNKNCDWEKVSDNTNFMYVIDDPDYQFKIADKFEELREAYKQGKTIQHMNLDGDWVDCDVPGFSANHSYRIKPEKKKDKIEELVNKLSVQEEFHKGNTIYYRNKTYDDSEWHPFSKATAGKDYQFDFKTYEYKSSNDLFPKEIIDKGCTLNISDKGFGELKDTLYRPFKDTDELIAYWEKHYGNGNRPEHTMPLIWIKGKDTGNVYLINGYEEGKCVYISADWWFDMEELFEQFKFLDGRCCGKVKE